MKKPERILLQYDTWTNTKDEYEIFTVCRKYGERTCHIMRFNNLIVGRVDLGCLKSDKKRVETFVMTISLNGQISFPHTGVVMRGKSFNIDTFHSS